MYCLIISSSELVINKWNDYMLNFHLRGYTHLKSNEKSKILNFSWPNE